MLPHFNNNPRCTTQWSTDINTFKIIYNLKKNLHGVVDRDNNIIIPFTYIKITNSIIYRDKYFWVYDGYLWFLIDTHNNMIEKTQLAKSNRGDILKIEENLKNIIRLNKINSFL